MTAHCYYCGFDIHRRMVPACAACRSMHCLDPAPTLEEWEEQERAVQRAHAYREWRYPIAPITFDVWADDGGPGA
jgi:hypothetical protein